jgi:hypothetical protein
MAATYQDVAAWFDRGVKNNATHLIVVCDTFDWDDYPVYVDESEDFYSVYDKYSGGQNMQRIMEVYDLKADKAEQLDKALVHNLPPR